MDNNGKHIAPGGSIISGLAWKLAERFGVQGMQFVIQIVLARLLDPEHYGVLSLMVIFTTLANVFIQNGFNTALVQNKDVTEEDYSSVFWVSLTVATVIYVFLYFLAPVIAVFYEIPELVTPLRVLSLILFPGAVNSVQLAKVNREMDFKQVFKSNVGAIIVSGIVGIVLAYADFGLWALVIQNITSVVTTTVVMWFSVAWRPRFVCNFARIKVLFSFGWKLLVSGLLDTLYQDLRSLVIGKKYDSGTLGFYNRGKQFPQFIINAINGAVQSVLLPAMSAEQDDKKKVKVLTRNSIMLSSYIIFPMMSGLAAVATSLVSLLLTDKWLPCVPYMQIYCFNFAFYPVHTSNLQAINAMGRSDIFLKLEIIKKFLGIGMLVVAVFCFESPIAIAMTGVFSAFTSSFINTYPNKKLIDYSYFEQMKDILPSLLISLVMFGGVLSVELLKLNAIVTLVLQVIAGVVIYVLLSALLRLEPYKMLLGMVKGLLKKSR